MGGHLFLAAVLLIYDWDFEASGAEYEAARRLGGESDAAFQFYYANYPEVTRGSADGLAQVKRAFAMDPLNAFYSHFVGHFLVWDRRYDEALAQEARTRDLSPDAMYLSSAAGDAYREKGLFDKAITEYEREEKILGLPSTGLAIVYARTGKPQKARAIAARLSEVSKKRYVAADRVAAIWVALGDMDRAVAWIEKGIETRDTWLTWIRVMPEFDALRNDPRYPGLLRRIGWKS
jgi:tetratricopeptide (TPR) repeat protein